MDNQQKESGDGSLVLLNMLGGLVLGAHALSKGTYQSLGSLSKWFIGGAFAFCYGVITSPESMMVAYGAIFIKLSLLSFLISSFFGFKFILGHHFHQVMSETDSGKFVEMNELLKKKDSIKENETEDFDDSKATEMAVKKSLYIIGVYFKAAKSFWYQALFMFPPLVAILWKVFFKIHI